jgi:hypothetical protein
VVGEGLCALLLLARGEGHWWGSHGATCPIAVVRAGGRVHDGLLRAHATHHGLVGTLQGRRGGEKLVRQAKGGKAGVGLSLRTGDGCWVCVPVPV